MSTVFRYDAGELKKATVSPQGYLKADAFFTRVGIFKYKKPDGTTQLELRPPEEVFKPESMKSFAEVPITNNHPPEPLDTSNTRLFSIGYSGSEVNKADIYLKGGVTVYDAKTISEIMEQNKNQISSGYQCNIENKGGIWNGMAYDVIQRNIKGNHIAIVREGRAGPNVKIKLDDVPANFRMDFAYQVDNEDEHRSDPGMEQTENEIRYRVKDPGGFKEGTFRTKALGKGISIIIGKEKSGSGSMVVQAYRFKKPEWTAERAKAWIEKHKDDKFTQTKIDTNAKKVNCVEMQNGVILKLDIKKGDPIMSTLKIGSVEHELPEEVASFIAKLEGDKKAKEDELDKLQAKLDAEEALKEDAKRKAGDKKGKDEPDPDDDEDEDEDEDEDKKDKGKKKDKKKDACKSMSKKDAIEYGRQFVEAEQFAKTIIGKEFKSDGLELIDIKKAILKKTMPADVKLDEKNEVYVEAAFDYFKANYKNPKAEALKKGLGGIKCDDGAPDVQKVRLDGMSKWENRWQQPIMGVPTTAKTE